MEEEQQNKHQHKHHFLHRKKDSKLKNELVEKLYLNIDDIPEASWKRKLSHEFKPNTEFKVGVYETFNLMGLAYRMWRYTHQERDAGRIPIMDPFAGHSFLDPIMGVPLGGIGCGAIDRGWRGDFVRWSVAPAGVVRKAVVSADQFSLFSHDENKKKPIASVMHAKSHKKNHGNANVYHSWNFNGVTGENSHYHGLFPLSWTVYDGEPDPDLKVTCFQVSPVIPNNYKESSYPSSVFVWKIRNKSKLKKKVSLMFSFQNGDGADTDLQGGHTNHVFNKSREAIVGILLHHDKPRKIAGVQYNDPLTYCIATKKDGGKHRKVTYVGNFKTNSKHSLSTLWKDFKKDGMLENTIDESPSQKGDTIGGALCVSDEVAGEDEIIIEFALTWDCPVARFSNGPGYYKRYTKFFGKKGDCAAQLAADALRNYPNWLAQISDWQKPILDNEKLPNFYKMALFNELYYIVDGGTVWTHKPVEHDIDENNVHADDKIEDNDIGHFFYLEGHEYLMCNTYDVHFYASFALCMNWPLIELSLQKDIAKVTSINIDDDWPLLHTGEITKRKVKGAVPHDLGNPGEDPWNLPNSYNIQQIDRWKDLSSKFILQVYRDFVFTQDIEFLKEVWPTVKITLRYSLKNFDKNKDGMIENEGFPDQTYDTWEATGCSSYSGGLWVAALKVATHMAYELKETKKIKEYAALYDKAKKVYLKLWNNKYFNYDETNGHQDSIQADQMAGQWYALSCGVGGIVPEEYAKSALKTIFEYNVCKFKNGTLGAVNGMYMNGKVDNSCLQSQEVWTGVNFAVIAAMIQAGLIDEAFKTLEGFVTASYTKLGYMFQTPEALTEDGYFRSLSYMRPLSIWAIQWALERAEISKNVELEDKIRNL